MLERLGDIDNKGKKCPIGMEPFVESILAVSFLSFIYLFVCLDVWMFGCLFIYLF
jgi:hypothetical protein